MQSYYKYLVSDRSFKPIDYSYNKPCRQDFFSKLFLLLRSDIQSQRVLTDKMITSSLFFQKTFFTIDEFSIKTKKTQNTKLDQIYNVQNKYKRPEKPLSSLNVIKNSPLKQKNKGNRNKNRYAFSNLHESTDDVSPWVQKFNPNGQMYEVHRQRQKIKNMIEIYRFGKNIQKEQENSALKVNIKINNNKTSRNTHDGHQLQFIPGDRQYPQQKSVKKLKNRVNLIKNIDINKSYANYLNGQIVKTYDDAIISNGILKPKSRSKRNEYLGCKCRKDIKFLQQDKSSSKRIINLQVDNGKCVSCQQEKQKSWRQLELESSIKKIYGEVNPASSINCQDDNRKSALDSKEIEKIHGVHMKRERNINRANKNKFRQFSTLHQTRLKQTTLKSISVLEQISLSISGNKTRKLQYSFQKQSSTDMHNVNKTNLEKYFLKQKQR